MSCEFELFEDGVAILGDAIDPEVLTIVKATTEGHLPLVVTDPPYGKILTTDWDKWEGTQHEFVQSMLDWTKAYCDLLAPGGAFYVWGGYGRPGFRPFFEYLSVVEHHTPLRMSNFITWSKKRARGLSYNYLATREDLAFFVKGDPKKPRLFNVPLLETKRGYSGYNPKYPAKSEFYRRTNVWMDVTELFSGKVHDAQKPLRLYEIPIETHTSPGEWVVDPFAGSMTMAHAARKTGRKWICVEKDEETYRRAVVELSTAPRRR